MTVEMALVTVLRHFHAASICPAIETFVKRHDVDRLPQVLVILLCQLHHTIFHRKVVVVGLELDPVISSPRVNLIDVFWTPNVIR